MDNTFEQFRLRPGQAQVLRYGGGRMGVSAVPGAGKTFTLSLLAARILREADLADDQEVLVVTLVNSAVDNFSHQIASLARRQGLLPGMGCRVRTLHGLANDIVRESPSSVGLDTQFSILDERDQIAILADVVRAWLAGNQDFMESYLAPLDEHRLARVRSEDLPRLVENIAVSAIRTAKDQMLKPDDLARRLDALPLPLPLAEAGAQLYAAYQRALSFRGMIDFDDLIYFAVMQLENNPALLGRLQERWPFILEDEAQDSSRLQERILRLLAGETGNWVRVGDPNQAIYETFTTANPRFLIDFLREPGVIARDLPESGRSSESIIQLANTLIDWTRQQHPLAEARVALTPPHIRTTPPDDPQPRAFDDPNQIFFIDQRFTPDQEIEWVADSLQAWVAENPHRTVAALSPTTRHGMKLADALKARKVEVVDALMKSSAETRMTAGALGNLLRFLSRPDSPAFLTRAFEVWRRGDREEEPSAARLARLTARLKSLRLVEDYLFPRAGRDWLAGLSLDEQAPDEAALLAEFREIAVRWLGAALLPVDQIILTLAQDIFQRPSELALAHKIAATLRQAARTHPEWSLAELGEELGVIARNERRFMEFSEDSSGFDPKKYPGKVIIATMHKAKGLEWDRVYLLSVNNYDFPAGLPGDTYQSEPYYVRDSLNLEAETLEQLHLLSDTDPLDWYEEGRASQQARVELIRERLRLLYVGVTRAREELVLTWNTGRIAAFPKRAAVPFVALQELWTARR